MHTIPDDFKKTLYSNIKIKNIWKTITPLAKNEWICWITSAKKVETRVKRISVAIDKLSKGTRRPCCWEGCPHR